MTAATHPVLDLYLLGLQSRDAHPDTESGFSVPTWTWPDPADGSAERPLPRLLDGRFVAPDPTEEGEADCRGDDPDRQALAILEPEPPAEIDAGTRARGDWRLAGGTPEGFGERVAEWQAAGFSRLLCLDPVHLKAETDHAITLGPRFLDLTDAELDRLVGEFNGWLADDGMRAERIGRQLYLLARVSEDGVGPASAGLQQAGAPLACLLNRNAGVFLDERHSEARLRQWLTEVQMWLYPQPFNDERAVRGAPILNSFWPHGMAELSELTVDHKAEAGLIISDSPAVLARHDAMVWSEADVERVAEAVDMGRPVQVELTEAAWCRLEGDLGGFQSELARIDDWLARLQDAAPNVPVHLHDGHGGSWRRESRLRRLWRGLMTRGRGRW